MIAFLFTNFKQNKQENTPVLSPEKRVRISLMSVTAYQFPRINFTVTKQELFIETNLKTFEICFHLDVKYR